MGLPTDSAVDVKSVGMSHLDSAASIAWCIFFGSIILLLCIFESSVTGLSLDGADM